MEWEEEAGTQVEETTSNTPSVTKIFSNVAKNDAPPEPKPLCRSEQINKSPLKLKYFVVTKKWHRGHVNMSFVLFECDFNG